MRMSTNEAILGHRGTGPDQGESCRRTRRRVCSGLMLGIILTTIGAENSLARAESPVDLTAQVGQLQVAVENLKAQVDALQTHVDVRLKELLRLTGNLAGARGAIAGKVIGLDATGLAGAFVEVSGAGAAAVVQPNGTFVIVNVPAGPREIVFHPAISGYGLGRQTVTVPAGASAANVVFDVSKLRIRARRPAPGGGPRPAR